MISSESFVYRSCSSLILCSFNQGRESLTCEYFSELKSHFKFVQDALLVVEGGL